MGQESTDFGCCSFLESNTDLSLLDGVIAHRKMKSVSPERVLKATLKKKLFSVQHSDPES